MRSLLAAFAARVSQYTTTITCLVTIAAFLALCIVVEGILKKG
jgi:hypothetical protein